MDRMLRLLAAGLLVTAGAIHLELWRDGYRGLPTIGPLFLLNTAASGVVAVTLILGRGRWPVVAGAAVAAGSLGALVLSRTVGFLGFTEVIWNRPALQVLAAETGALVALGLALVPLIRHRPVLARVRVPAGRAARSERGT